MLKFIEISRVTLASKTDTRTYSPAGRQRRDQGEIKYAALSFIHSACAGDHAHQNGYKGVTRGRRATLIEKIGSDSQASGYSFITIKIIIILHHTGKCVCLAAREKGGMAVS